MLIEDWRPKLYCKGFECQNISPDNNVFFLEEGHKYYYKEDIDENNRLTDFEKSKFMFRSPTGLIGDLYEHFDTVPQAKKYVKKHKLPITWEQLVYAWEFLADYATEEGTTLHAYGESLFNGWDMPTPELDKQKYVLQLYNEIIEKYDFVKTELLVYSKVLRIAGQVDLLLKTKGKKEYHIFDYKFLKEPIKKKSFYNWKTKQFKMMLGPFSKLMDCNFYHYSIQLEIYRYLMGAVGKKVGRKTLMVVTKDGYELVDAHPINIFVSKTGVLHAEYRHYKNKLYKSAKDPEYLKNPYKIL